MSLSRSVLAERLLGLASLTVLLGVVTAVDDARGYLAAVTTNPAAELATIAEHSSRMGHAILATLGLQAVDHTAIIALGLASLGLVVVMFRT